jgi:hypothetical protein
MNFKDLKSLPKEKQIQILDDYYDRFNMTSVAKIWGEEVKNDYNRYTLRNSLEKAKKKEANVKENADEQNQVGITKICLNPKII